MGKRSSGLAAVVVVIVAIIAVYAYTGQGVARTTGVSTQTTSSSESLESSSLSAQTSVMSPSTTTTTSNSSTSTQKISTETCPTSSSSCYSLVVGDMGVDVTGPGFAHLIYNSTDYQSNQFYAGNAGGAFNINVELRYNNCNSSANACPTMVTNVTVTDPGWSVSGTSPNLPVTSSDLGTSGVVEDFSFIVTVQSPSTPYNGPLDVVCALN